ncbi:MAG: DNA starvation/stationary phase protection protein [Gemmatimonadota bacterium]
MSKRIAGQLQVLLADSTVFYQKLRHYHWNVQGPKFFELHAKFEEIYEKWAPFVDQIAERIIALDTVPLHTLKDMLKHATLKEDPELSDGKEMVNRTIADLNALRGSMNKIIAAAEKAGDRSTANLLDDLGDAVEGDVWMLKAWLKTS